MRHVCDLGSPTYLPLVRELCRKTEDDLEVLEYPRLSPLTVSGRGLKSYKVRKEFYSGVADINCLCGRM